MAALPDDEQGQTAKHQGPAARLGNGAGRDVQLQNIVAVDEVLLQLLGEARVAFQAGEGIAAQGVAEGIGRRIGLNQRVEAGRQISRSQVGKVERIVRQPGHFATEAVDQVSASCWCCRLPD